MEKQAASSISGEKSSAQKTGSIFLLVVTLVCKTILCHIQKKKIVSLIFIYVRTSYFT